jgi:hypothetical protein
MNLKSIVIGAAAIVGGAFLADILTNLRLRFWFSPGSIGRHFFFSISVQVLLILLTFAALVSYSRGWKTWRKQERYAHGALLLVPLCYWVLFWVWAFTFVRSGNQ